MCNIWKRCFYTSESLRIYKDTRNIVNIAVHQISMQYINGSHYLYPVQAGGRGCCQVRADGVWPGRVALPRPRPQAHQDPPQHQDQGGGLQPHPLPGTYTVIYNIYTVYLQYLYSLSTLYIAMKYFSKYCIYLYNGTDQTSVKGSLTVHWSNDPMNHFVALPHRTKINQLRKESNRNNIKTIQLPRIKIHVLNRSSEYKDVPTQFTETEMSGWKCDNSFKVPRRL